MTFFSRLRSFPKTAWRGVLIALAVVVLLYCPIGTVWVHRVDDSPAFAADIQTEPRASVAVATAIAVIDREVNQHYWTPNDPFFQPGWLLTRMPAFQRGLMSTVTRFTLAMADQIARTRGTSAMDRDLGDAVGRLNYPPDVWIYNPEVSRFLPTVSTETTYRAGAEALIRYNTRLSKGEAIFEPRADNLIDALDKFAADLGSSSALIDAHVHERSGFAFRDSAKLYYETKGKMYGYFLLTRALAKDYAQVIAERQLGPAWEQMQTSLYEGAELSNFIVLNAAADSQFVPNHLAAQGFYVMRARTQMREITNILLK